MAKKLIFGILVLIFLWIPIGYAENINDIFTKSLDPDINYKATIEIYIEDQVQKMQFIHINDYHGYIFEIGNKRIFIVKKGDTIGKNINIQKGSFSFLGLNLPKKEELILKNYKIINKGVENIIGRQSYHISLIPIYDGNIKEEIWIDKETYIQLKTQIYDWNGKFIKGKKITDLVIYRTTPSILNEMKEILKKGSKKLTPWFTSYKEAELKLKVKLLKPEWIPKGYELVGIHLSNRFKDTIHIVYTNGIGYISLYEKKVPIWARRGKGPHKGPHPDWEKKGIRLLLVGDVTEDALYKMAKSIK